MNQLSLGSYASLNCISANSLPVSFLLRVYVVTCLFLRTSQQRFIFLYFRRPGAAHASVADGGQRKSVLVAVRGQRPGRRNFATTKEAQGESAEVGTEGAGTAEAGAESVGPSGVGSGAEAAALTGDGAVGTELHFNMY